MAYPRGPWWVCRLRSSRKAVNAQSIIVSISSSVDAICSMFTLVYWVQRNANLWKKYFFTNITKVCRRKEYTFSYCILGHGPFLVHCPYSEPVLVTVRQVQYLFLGEKKYVYFVFKCMLYIVTYSLVSDALENISRNAFTFIYLITGLLNFVFSTSILINSQSPIYTVKIIASKSWYTDISFTFYGIYLCHTDLPIPAYTCW